MSLKESIIKEYWKGRYTAQGGLACGFAGRAVEFQQALLGERIMFFRKHLPLDLVTLDYGCGTGAYCELFMQHKYLGADIARSAIELARVSHKDYRFLHLEGIYLSMRCIPAEMIFTATVLQHCNDALVRVVLKELARHIKPKVIAIYEADNGKEVAHCVGRGSSQYVTLVREYFAGYVKHTSHSHTVHGEQHTLTIIHLL